MNGPSGTLLRSPRGGLAVGEAVTVRYVPLPISRVSTEARREGVLDAAAQHGGAAPPVVDEVIPSFARGADGARSGQVLRVYLARPWLVTGDGEQLAVVCPGGSSAGSVVGRDPITRGTGRDLTLTGDAFPRATSVVTDGGRTVVAHAVSFDPGSERWYADVELGCGFRLPAVPAAGGGAVPAGLDRRGDACRRSSPSSRYGSASSGRPRSSGAGASST